MLYEKYMDNVSAFSRISREREQELANTLTRSKNLARVEAAVNELVESNLLLVLRCCADYAPYLRNPDVRIGRMDLIAEGNIGLLSAARNYNPARRRAESGEALVGIPFSSYAYTCIRHAMQRALKKSSFIHVPEYHFSYWKRLDRIQSEHGKSVDDATTSSELGLSQARLKMIKHGKKVATSLLGDIMPEDKRDWQDCIRDDCDSPDVEADKRDMKEYLLKELESLPERTARMLRMMYLSEAGATLGDLAREFGVSTERCRQICADGLKKLRKRLEGKMDKVLGRSVSPAFPSGNSDKASIPALTQSSLVAA